MAETALLNNRYQLLEPLGTGGMAQVYRARDLMLERFVAIKILRADYSADPELQVRFRQEAKSAANLSHPNIVTVHDFGFDHDQLFIVMEHIPGKDLKNLLLEEGLDAVYARHARLAHGPLGQVGRGGVPATESQPSPPMSGWVIPSSRAWRAMRATSV